MFKISAELKKSFFLFYPLVLSVSFCWAAEHPGRTGAPSPIRGVWDSAKYITVDEIRPGMEAYCLTGYKGTEIEKFDVEILSVVRNAGPGRDVILVQGTDERFIHTGPVAGCSGSPVYIDGRLGGALAYMWPLSKDPFYVVTPIEDMLKVGEVSHSGESAGQMGFVFDFSKPIDFAEIDRQITGGRLSGGDNLTGATALGSQTRYSALAVGSRLLSFANGAVVPLPCPLVTYGLPAEVCEQLGALVEPFGLMAVAGIGGSGDMERSEDVQLVPGACLVVPLLAGDITMEIIGTVTEVVGDDVYSFGHGLLGYGPIDLPMATGQVHTVVSSLYRSFKFASALEVVGALRTDESAAVRGRIGAKARMIPLTITVDRYNDAERREYNCQVANNRLLTPWVLRSAVAGAALMLGRLPPDHMIRYKVTIGLEGFEPIVFENVSTALGLNEMIVEGTVPVALLMNNPYEKVDIESVDFDVRIVPKNIVSHIWSVDLSDSKVKAGQEVGVSVVVESYLSEKKKYQFSLRIPYGLAPGRYDLNICGGYGYREFLRKAAPYRFVPQNLATLIEAMNNLLHISRDRLYCLLVLPPSGVTVEKAELPDLPATKTLVLQDVKRTLIAQPYSHWLEKSFHTGTVIINKKIMHITVEK